MATLTIRNLDDGVRDRLRIQAARHGRSMEAEARAILQAGVVGAPRLSGQAFADAVRARFEKYDGIDLELPEREPLPPPIEFDE